MERNEIVEKLTTIFREIFADGNLTLSDEMTADDVDKWDSLSHTAMIAKVEEVFQIKFKLRDLNKMKKVGDLIELVSSKL